MKKITAILLTAIIFCMLGVSVLADDVVSPGPGPQHKINIVIATTGGDVSYTYDPSTGSYTITATAEPGHQFIKYIIKGGHTLISGTPTDPVIVVKLTQDAEVIAYFDGEPTAIKVTVEEGTKGGVASVAYNKNDATFTLKADTEKGYTFKKWDLTGEYRIISGSLTSEVLVIEALTSVHGIANWNSEKGTSPVTGYSVTGFAALAVVSVIGTAYAVKKFHNA